MRAKVRHAQYLLALVVVFAAPAMAQWTNGQDATYVLGQADFTSKISTTSQDGMNRPYSVAVDLVNGKLYVSELNNNRVLRFAYPITGNQPNAEAVLGQADFVSGDANRGGMVAANTLYAPCGLAVDSSGRLWVADSINNRILRFDSAHTKANGADADGVLGQANFTSWLSSTTQNGMKYGYQLALTSGGTLFVADGPNNRVLRFDDAASKANGANADGVLGQADYTSSGSATTQAGMSWPQGVCVDGTTLYVADTDNYRVLRFDNAAGKANGANADGVLGQPDYTSGGWATTQAGLGGPTGLAIDTAGRLYVADSGNTRVMIFNSAAGKANGANADNVLGQENFTSSAAATAQNRMDNARGVCTDSTNNRLFVADFQNHRVLQFNASGALPVEMSAFGVE